VPILDNGIFSEDRAEDSMQKGIGIQRLLISIQMPHMDGRRWGRMVHLAKATHTQFSLLLGSLLKNMREIQT
jgi:hypothetical protein